MRLPLLGGANAAISSNISPQECINFYWEPPPEGEAGEGAYLPVHGSTLFGTATNTGVIRAMAFDPGDSLLYVVSDDKLYSVTSGGVFTERATLTNASGRCEIAINPPARELVVVNSNSGMHYDIVTTTATTITDTSFPDESPTVAYINGRFAVASPNTAGVWNWSDLNDGLTYDALSTATAETFFSVISKIIVNRNDIWLFGEHQAEVWYNSGDPDFVFQRFELIETGCVAGATVQQFDNTVAWLRQDARGRLQAVWSSESYLPKAFSTPQLSQEWNSYATVTDAFAWTYQIDGHEFYVITFPTGNASFAYDATTGRWSQRSGAFSASEPIRDYGSCFVATTWAADPYLVGDYNSTGKIWSLDDSVTTWEGNNMERRITGPLISGANESRLRISEAQLDIEEGVINVADAGNDRQVTLYWSKDGGHTYNTGVQLDIGEAAVDGYTHRLMQRKLGQGRLWNFRVYSDTPRKLIIKGLWGRMAGERFDGVFKENATEEQKQE